MAQKVGHMCENGLQVLAKKQLLLNSNDTLLTPCTHGFVGNKEEFHFKNHLHQRR
jgi:hypothetical protein